MKREIKKNHIHDEYGLDEIIDLADANRHLCPWRDYHTDDDFRMAREGWQKGLRDAMSIAKSALSMVEKEVALPSFQAEWLMSGSEVDVGRYLQGVPECMIEYEPIKVSKVGRVVTLCAGLNVYAEARDREIMRRGAVIVALALALEESQHAVEVWVDCSGTYHSGGKKGTVKVLVKGAHDMIDPSRLAFALGHPVMLRGIMHTIRSTWPGQFRVDKRGLIPMYPPKTLPEGTIYLPAEVGPELITRTLKDLGLVEDDR